MSKQIQAYFRTESEAEGARTTLQTYHVDQLEVGQLEAPLGRRTNIIVPLVPWNVSGVGGAAAGTAPITGNGTSAAPGAIVGVRPDQPGDDTRTDDAEWVDGDHLTDSDYDDLKYVLSGKVSDTDYDEIVQVLRKNHAYVEHFE